MCVELLVAVNRENLLTNYTISARLPSPDKLWHTSIQEVESLGASGSLGYSCPKKSSLNSDKIKLVNLVNLVMLISKVRIVMVLQLNLLG